MEVQKRRAVDYSEIDVDAPGHGQWKNVYDYDVPVLHIDKLTQAQSDGQVTSLDAAKKLMHRFTVEEVEAAVDEVGS
ncbi:hypothetical protein PV11_06709 [Exophiala sideris]|uniref:Glutaredoxin-like protein n=1 Tax=Exophiala sideris TaxID=1016849 RepID=A0A0D1WVF5_9EURO|nr:hypothetical protein PV11_06709 [Exophiala sideris]